MKPVSPLRQSAGKCRRAALPWTFVTLADAAYLPQARRTAGTAFPALAAAGIVGFARIRRLIRSLADHPEDLQAGLDCLLALKHVDRKRIAVIGYSRGGAPGFMVVERSGRPGLVCHIPLAIRIPVHDHGYGHRYDRRQELER